MPRLLVLGPVLLLALTGCGKDAPTVATPTPTGAARPTTAAPTSTLPPGVDQLVAFSVRGGQVVAGPRGRVKVRQGSTVRLVVTSDKADEVHLHGYDQMADVAAGGTAQLTFTASIPGVFEVELEKSKVAITRLQVQ